VEEAQKSRRRAKAGGVVVVDGKMGGDVNGWPAIIKGSTPLVSKAMVHTRSSARSKSVPRLASNPQDQYTSPMAPAINLASFGLYLVPWDGWNER